MELYDKIQELVADALLTGASWDEVISALEMALDTARDDATADGED